MTRRPTNARVRTAFERRGGGDGPRGKGGRFGAGRGHPCNAQVTEIASSHVKIAAVYDLERPRGPAGHPVRRKD